MSDEKKSGMPKWLVEVLTVAIPVAPALALPYKQDLGAWLASRTNDSLAIGALLLLICIVSLLVWVARLRPWLRWDEPVGTWTSGKGLRYCEKCRSGSSKLSPLKNEKTGWRCMSCERFYFDPSRKIDLEEVACKLTKSTTPRI